MRKYGRDLEGSSHPAACDLCRILLGDVAALEPDGSAGWRYKFRQQIENGSFTGAVGTNEAVDASLADLQVHVAHGDEPLELFDQVPRLENIAGFHFGVRPPGLTSARLFRPAATRRQRLQGAPPALSRRDPRAR